jgi:hypothetical protein
MSLLIEEVLVIFISIVAFLLLYKYKKKPIQSSNQFMSVKKSEKFDQIIIENYVRYG